MDKNAALNSSVNSINFRDNMTDFFDELENRAPDVREQALFDKMPDFLEDIKSRIPGWKKRLAEVNSSEITSRNAFEKIPVMRKPDLMEAQAAKPPFGEFIDTKLLNGSRIFMSPGPVWEAQAPGPDPWLAARALYSAGIRAGDIVQCAIGFSMTPGGAILDEGIRALGAICYPSGVGNTEAQVQAIAALKSSAYVGTPDFLNTILEKADEMGIDVSSLNKAMVSGGALFPAMRKTYEARGIRVTQAYATADIGSIAHETHHNDLLCEGMICNEDMIVEIVRPGTDIPVPPGEVGEIVVTTFNQTYPLVRFGTGDMSAIIEEPSPCGRTNTRIKGWMGRADQRTKIKGMFVDPKQISEIVSAVDGLEKAKLIVSRDGNADLMTLNAVGTNLDEELLTEQLQQITKLKGVVKIVPDLPNDGLVIEDKRDYSA